MAENMREAKSVVIRNVCDGTRKRSMYQARLSLYPCACRIYYNCFGDVSFALRIIQLIRSMAFYFDPTRLSSVKTVPRAR